MSYLLKKSRSLKRRPKLILKVVVKSLSPVVSCKYDDDNDNNRVKIESIPSKSSLKILDRLKLTIFSLRVIESTNTNTRRLFKFFSNIILISIYIKIVTTFKSLVSDISNLKSVENPSLI